MKQASRGQTAEAATVKYLKLQGHQIVARNWRIPSCEIDIISQLGPVVYFTEVKYRANSGQGDGFDYITNRKLKQMEFAARNWCQAQGWEGDWRLQAAAVTGANCQDIQLLEI